MAANSAGDEHYSIACRQCQPWAPRSLRVESFPGIQHSSAVARDRRLPPPRFGRPGTSLSKPATVVFLSGANPGRAGLLAASRHGSARRTTPRRIVSQPLACVRRPDGWLGPTRTNLGGTVGAPGPFVLAAFCCSSEREDNPPDSQDTPP